MALRRSYTLFLALALIFFCLAEARLQAQQTRPSPTPSPEATPQREDQEPIKVFTEEVRLPIVAFDDYGLSYRTCSS
jgi:hypothetical protein